MAITLNFKYITIYRDVMHTPSFDWCQIMKMGTSNIMIKQFLALANSSDLLHQCPYKVWYKLITYYNAIFHIWFWIFFITSICIFGTLCRKQRVSCRSCLPVTTSWTFTSKPTMTPWLIANCILRWLRQIKIISDSNFVEFLWFCPYLIVVIFSKNRSS